MCCTWTYTTWLTYQCLLIAIADMRIRIMNRTTAMKEPITEPEMRSQKRLYCWQKGNQLVFGFPLCATYTMAAAAEAPVVRRPNITFTS